MPSYGHSILVRSKAQDYRGAGSGSDLVEQGSDGRRLSSAVGAEETEDLAFLDFQGKVLNAAFLAVVLGQSTRVNGRPCLPL